MNQILCVVMMASSTQVFALASRMTESKCSCADKRVEMSLSSNDFEVGAESYDITVMVAHGYLPSFAIVMYDSFGPVGARVLIETEEESATEYVAADTEWQRFFGVAPFRLTVQWDSMYMECPSCTATVNFDVREDPL